MQIEIKSLDPELAPHFARLNRAWIKRLFALELADEAILANPQELVDQGGAVLFVLADGEVVGTGGLQRLNDSTVEIVQMAVDPTQQGKGLGGRLMKALLQVARDKGYVRAYIETNSSLVASNGLYRKSGFTETGQSGSRHGYARADIFYEKEFCDGSD